MVQPTGRPGPILTPTMINVIRALRAADRPLSAREVGERVTGKPTDMLGLRTDQVRPRLDELITCGWVERSYAGVRLKRTDPHWLYTLTDHGKIRAELDLGPASKDNP